MSTVKRTERGAATAELVIATPLLLLLVLGIIQFALWQHATHVAQAAAQEGARAARLDGGSGDAGRSTAQSFLDQLGSQVIVSPSIEVTQTALTSRVVVTGSAEQVIPILTLPVRGVSEGSREVFTP